MTPGPEDMALIARHPSAFIPGSDRYLAVAAFLAGGRGLDWLTDWQQFVSVQIADNVVQAWPHAVLVASFSDEESRQLLAGHGSAELNARAVAILFQKLDEFIKLSPGARDQMLAAYRRMHDNG